MLYRSTDFAVESPIMVLKLMKVLTNGFDRRNLIDLHPSSVFQVLVDENYLKIQNTMVECKEIHI